MWTVSLSLGTLVGAPSVWWAEGDPDGRGQGEWDVLGRFSSCISPGLPPTLKEGPPKPPLMSPTPAPSNSTRTSLCQAPSLDSTG